MREPKPFQSAAVEAALAAFALGKERRRFLVADEVGLGKTVVAKEIASRMSKCGSRPLSIYYIANGHAVSHQNKRRIVDFLDDDQLDLATKTPDRLSLIAFKQRPKTPVLIYALTPATSFPGVHMPRKDRRKKTQLTGGRKEERAFLRVLLERSCPNLAEAFDFDDLQLNANKFWKEAVKQARKEFDSAPSGLRWGPTIRSRSANSTPAS